MDVYILWDKRFFIFFSEIRSSQSCSSFWEIQRIILCPQKSFVCWTDRLKLTQSGDNSPNKNPTEIKINLFKKKKEPSKKLVAAWRVCQGRREKFGVYMPEHYDSTLNCLWHWQKKQLVFLVKNKTKQKKTEIKQNASNLCRDHFCNAVRHREQQSSRGHLHTILCQHKGGGMRNTGIPL